MAEVEVVSEITGAVFAVLIEAGASVDTGTELLVLESMKMEIPLLAPVAGRVVRVAVRQGEAVKEGQRMVVIETAS